MWKQLSEELKTTTAATVPRLVHVGGSGVAGRTGLVWAKGLIVTLARDARDGEPVPVSTAAGAPVTATVRAWDRRTGLALLDAPDVSGEAWVLAPTPTLGQVVLTVAVPSPHGPEARLDLVRFVGGASEWGAGVELQSLIQTDGPAFPGFGGAAVIDADGALVGLVAENRSGNGGFVVAASDLARHVDHLIQAGSFRKAWLGVATKPAGGQGLSLLSVEVGSPADQAGWKAGDLLVTLADHPLRDPGDLSAVLLRLTAGTSAPAKLLRDGEVLDRPVVPGGR